MPTASLPGAENRRSSVWYVTVFLCALSGVTARADSYAVPDDYEIVCLERATGKLLWRTKPEGLRPPRLTLVDGVLAVAPKNPPPPPPDEPPEKKLWFLDPKEQSQRKLWLLDARSGELLQSRPDPSKKPTRIIGSLKSLPRNLERTDGTRYAYSAGTTRHLTTIVDGKRTVVKHLERFIRDLHVFGDVALFTFSDTAGGEVFAYHLVDDRLVWEFDASKIIEVPEGGYTGIAIDGERALVSTAQTLFAIDPHTGRVLWMSALPRQGIARYDAPWTRMARLGEHLVIQCYQDLFLLDATDGKVIWSFDCGWLGEPWPTVGGDRFYLAARGDFRGLERPEFKPLPKWFVTTTSRLPSAVVVSRGRYYSLDFLSKRDLPAGKDVWWSLRPPPPSRGRKRYTIVFYQNYENQRTEVDITVPLSRDTKVYVKYYRKADKVSLLENGEVVVEEFVPRRWPPRNR